MECYEALIDSAIRAVEGGAPLAQVKTEGCPAWQPDGPWCEQLAYLLTATECHLSSWQAA